MQLPEISDEMMRVGLATMKPYSAVILRKTEKFVRPAVDAIIWEHGRHNYALRAAGVMPIVCPVPNGGNIAGLCILDVGPDEARGLMEDDPGVKAGVFTYEVLAIRSFPGDRLPG